MSPQPSPAPAPALASEARPIDASERIALLDVLRGFALCGVFVSNVASWFSGRTFLPREQMETLMASASVLDKVTVHGISLLVSGKFITLFSFLFGVGFSVQLLRAEARGTPITPLYVRRLCALLLLGAVHLLALWYGDILTSYALLGFALLLFRRSADKTLLLWAAVFIFVVPPAVDGLMRWLPGLLGGASEEAAKAATEHTTRVRAQTLEAFTNGTYLEVVRANLVYYVGVFIKPLLTVLIALLGRFLLGLLAGRRRLFHDAPQHLPFFRKLLGWGLFLGALSGGTAFGVFSLMRQKLIDPQSPWMFLMHPVRQLNEVSLAGFYIAVLVLLFQRPVWQRLLLVLAPVGRMA
ncbi:MAG TPA: DUF418 domain-containing protein, partial [Archangium sp.]|nr:DUF418 domain-containing protein [Archangium sp.]